MELVIARAVAEAVEAAQAPLLARIEELTQAVERLSQRPPEPPEGTQTTASAPDAPTAAQRPVKNPTASGLSLPKFLVQSVDQAHAFDDGLQLVHTTPQHLPAWHAITLAVEMST